MVLADIGARISGALKRMMDATVINDAVIDELLKEVCNTMLQADVSVKLVIGLKASLKKTISLDNMGAGANRRNIIRQAVFSELCKLLDSGVKAYSPVKGKMNIIIFVGLQGNGKTTTVGKYAHYYKKRGFKPALLCLDTFRAGAYDQLLQTAASAKVSFYGSRTERDPVRIALDGIERLKDDAEGFDMIIVDTSGRHKQEASLFSEMQEIVDAVNPDQIVFVMDGSMGQAAFDQAQAFKNAVKVGSVIVTKLDGLNAKGGGALSAVAATQSPIIFLGTGEHLENLEPFDPQSFVSRMLGWGDMKGIADIVSTAMGDESASEKTKEMTAHLKEGKFSMRDMYSQFEMLSKMGPLSNIIERIPGTGQIAPPNGDDGTQLIKSFLVVMDSMTDDEIDNPKIIIGNDSRMRRVARGSGKPIATIKELFSHHKKFSSMVASPMMSSMLSGKKGPPLAASSMKGINPSMAKQMSIVANAVKQMGTGGGNAHFLEQASSSSSSSSSSSASASSSTSGATIKKPPRKK